MGFRFQRCIRLAPGVRLFTCKLRPGLSVGPPSICLPLATGEKDEPVPVCLDIAANGDIRYRHPDGRRLREDQARAIRRYGETAIREALASHCDKLNADLDALDRLHEQTPPTAVTGYEPRSYPVPPPLPLHRQQPDWRHLLWPAARARLEQENARREASHAEAYRAWEWEKAEFDACEFERQQREEVAVWSDPEAMQQTLAERLNELYWPRETRIDFALSDDAHTIALDIDLPDANELPDRYWTMPAKRLKLSARKLGTMQQRELYRRHVHGVAFRVLGTIFARLPGIERVLISGHCRVEGTASGESRPRYLFSAKVTRESWEAVDFHRLARLDPVEALTAFSLRRDMTRAGTFRDITPFELDWRWR